MFLIEKKFLLLSKYQGKWSVTDIQTYAAKIDKKLSSIK